MNHKRKLSEPKLDEEVEETFPASDPPSYMGSTAVAGSPKDGAHKDADGAGPRVVKEQTSVDLNKASAEELGSLPALGPGHVRALVSARPFKSWDDIKRLEDFDDKTVAGLKEGGAFIGY
jgi:DNA uptake protein ComE-like DNA-binding protein